MEHCTVLSPHVRRQSAHAHKCLHMYVCLLRCLAQASDQKVVQASDAEKESAKRTQQRGRCQEDEELLGQNSGVWALCIHSGLTLDHAWRNATGPADHG